MSKPIIVTGGAGFIGRNLVAALNARGREDIVIVDALGKGGKWKNLVGLGYEDYREKHDFISDVHCGALPEAEAVFHLGACSSTTESDADYLAENNYRYTRHLCEWCLAHKTRFIYASSAATYGDGHLGYGDDDETTRKLEPLNMYGYSKQMFDLWALRQGLFDRIAGLKYFNVYGPHEAHKGEMRSMVHKAWGQALADGKVRLFRSYKPEFRDGEQLRDFIYVDDAVRVTLYFFEHPEISGLFNCGTGQARTWNDLAEGVFAALGREPKIAYVDMPEELLPTYQYFTQADVTKLRAAGYDAPFTALEDGIRDYVQNYLVVSE